MFREHEQVVPAVDPTGDEGESLSLGDVGHVHVHPIGEVYMLDFMALDGDTSSTSTEMSQACLVETPT